MTLITNTLEDSEITFPETAARRSPYHYRSRSAFARPGNTNAYAIGETISDHVSTLKAIGFPNCAGMAGGSGRILGATVMWQEAQANAPDLELLIFESEPSGHADGGTLNLVASNDPILVGSVYLEPDVSLSATRTLWVPARQDQTAGFFHPMSYVCRDATNTRSLFGLLTVRTDSGYTPTSGSKLLLSLDLEID